MNEYILMTAVMPHPPIIIPEIGKNETLKTEKTISGLKKLSREIVDLNPETIVIVTPHSEFNRYFFSVYSAEILTGNFERFGVSETEVKLEFENDSEFIEELRNSAKEDFIKLNNISPEILLDHGSCVPLYYLSKAGYKGKIVVINYTMLDKEQHKLFGKFIAETAKNIERKTVFIASGDLSHKLIPGAPAGYSPKAKDFDELIINSIKTGDYKAITDITFEMRETAGECGYNSLMTAFGVLGDKPQNNEVISYEGPFGVGYVAAKL